MIGGGNSALQEALLLSEVCSKVTIVQNLSFLTGRSSVPKRDFSILQNILIIVKCSPIIMRHKTKSS